MKKPKVYIDGQAGTTGLQIRERLENRSDLELLILDDALRHDEKARREIMAQADLVFLCLPDQAAVEAAAMVPDTTKIIDASTAHRTKWNYGFPELSHVHQEAIRSAQKVANPGCHASGVIALLYPLVQSGLISDEEIIHIVSLTGYSGGGRKMIEEYEGSHREDPLYQAPRVYGTSLQHKHIPEIQKVAHLKNKPLFVPVVDDYYQGMTTIITLPASSFTREAIPAMLRRFYQDWYRSAKLISVADTDSQTMISAAKALDGDNMFLAVDGNEDQILLTAVFNNLGKGASGAAVQNMNLMLGLYEMAGLKLCGPPEE